MQSLENAQLAVRVQYLTLSLLLKSVSIICRRIFVLVLILYEITSFSAIDLILRPLSSESFFHLSLRSSMMNDMSNQHSSVVS